MAVESNVWSKHEQSALFNVSVMQPPLTHKTNNCWDKKNKNVHLLQLDFTLKIVCCCHEYNFDGYSDYNEICTLHVVIHIKKSN